MKKRVRIRLRFGVAYGLLVFCLLGASYAFTRVGHSHRPPAAAVQVRRETARELLAMGVVTAFLTALQQDDRATACTLYPSFAPCRSHGRFTLAGFQVLSASRRGSFVVVTAVLEGTRGKFLLAPAGAGFVIVAAAAA